MSIFNRNQDEDERIYEGEYDHDPLLDRIERLAHKHFNRLTEAFGLNKVSSENSLNLRDGSSDRAMKIKGLMDLSRLFGEKALKSSLSMDNSQTLSQRMREGVMSAKDEFKRRYKTSVDKLNINDDEIEYHRLYEMGLGNLAEKLKTIQLESLDCEHCPVTVTLEIYPEEMNQTKKQCSGSLRLGITLNWSKNNAPDDKQEWKEFANVSFASKEELIEELDQVLGGLVYRVTQ